MAKYLPNREVKLIFPRLLFTEITIYLGVTPYVDNFYLAVSLLDRGVHLIHLLPFLFRPQLLKRWVVPFTV